MPCQDDCTCDSCTNWQTNPDHFLNRGARRVSYPAPKKLAPEPERATLKLIELLRLLQFFSLDSEVIGPSCLPIKVIQQDDGSILFAEVAAPFRKAVVSPDPKSDPSAAFIAATAAGPRPLSRSDYTPEDRSVFGDTQCKLPSETPDRGHAEFTNKINFRDTQDIHFPIPERLLNEDGCMIIGAKPDPATDTKIVISVYIDNGNVFEYDVKTPSSAREHVSAIIATGYRHSDKDTPDEMVHFPPHRIAKVKMRGPGITTKYYDRSIGT